MEADSTRKTYSSCAQCDQINRVPLLPPGGKTPVCGKCKAELPLHDNVSELSASAVRVLSEKSPLPVVVDFWAPWCQPCLAFAPVFKQAARELAGRVVFAKVDTQANPLAGDAFGIRGIPTLVVLEGGVERARQSGAVPLGVFLQWLQGVLAKG